MSKKKYLIYFKTSHFFLFYQFFFSIIIFYSNLYIVHNTVPDIYSPYPIVLQLDDNNLFIANKKGMFFCDINLSNEFSHDYYNKEIPSFENINNKVLIDKFENTNGYNVICLVENVFYLFNENKSLMKQGNLPTQITESAYLNLVAYKISDNYYHFIVCFMDALYKNLYIYHYKANSIDYTIVSNIIYKPFYLDYTSITINNNLFTCQIMNPDKIENVLTCVYQSYNRDLIVVQSFDIDNDLQEIEEYYSKIPIDNLVMIKSVISVDKKNMFVCYSLANKYGYCFTYNFDNNLISNNKPLLEECDSKYTNFKINYFPQTEEYTFICHNNNKFTILMFDNNFQKINPEEITTQNFEISEYYNFN